MKREEEQQEERDKNNGNAQIINKVVNYNFMFEIPRQNVQPKKGPRHSQCAEPSSRASAASEMARHKAVDDL